MKALHLLLVLFLIAAFVPPALAADSVSASLSSGSGSPEIPPQDLSVYINSTRAAVSERNWSGALLLSAQGIAYYPDSADLLCLQGYVYRKLGQPGQSVEIISRGIRLDPRAVRYANRGYGYLALGNYSAALADAKTGIGLDAGYATNYAVEALALQGLGQNAEARDAINEGIAREPGNAHFRAVQGKLLSQAGNCTGAREAFERSVSLDPDYSLPWPGFAGAREDLASLNASCVPAAAPASPLPQPTKAPLGWIAAAGIAAAACAIAMRK